MTNLEMLLRERGVLTDNETLLKFPENGNDMVRVTTDAGGHLTLEIHVRERPDGSIFRASGVTTGDK